MAKREIRTVLALDGEQKYKDAIKAINKEQTLLRTELKNTTAQLDLNGSAQDKLKAQSDSLTKQIELQRKKIDEAKNAVKQATERYGENSETTKTLKIEVANAEAALAKMEKQLQGVNKEIALNESELKKSADAMKKAGEQAEASGKKWQETGKKIEAVGSGWSKYITAPVLGLATAAVAVGNAYEEQMSRVEAISQATAREMERLDELALKLGADTKYSAREVAEGMENLSAAGFTANETMKAMPGLLDLAASSGEGLASSSEIAAATLRGFGLEADKAGHVADVLAKNAAATNAAIADTGLAMKYIAPIAKNAGWSIEQVTAAIGAMADAGIKGEQAGTTLRGALTSLMNPSKEQAKAMESIGFNAYDSAGKMKSLSEIIKELDNRTRGLTDEQRDNAIATIVGTNALSGMQVLLNTGSRNLDKLTESLKNSDGAASDMAKTMMDNTKGSIEEMMGSLETAGIKIQRAIAPTVKDLAGFVGDLAEKFSELTEEEQAALLKKIAIVAAIGPLIKGFGTVVTTVGKTREAYGKYIQKLAEKEAAEAAAAATSTATASATTAVGTASTVAAGKVTTLGTAFKGLLGPIGLVTAALGGIYVAYQKSSKEIEKERRKVIDAKYDELEKQAEELYAAELKRLSGETDTLNTELSKRERSIGTHYDRLETKADENLEKARAAIEAETEALNEAHQQRMKEIDEERAARLALIDATANDAVKRLKAEMDAIDEQTKAEEKAEKQKKDRVREQELIEAINTAQTDKEKRTAEQNLAAFRTELERAKTLELREQQKQQLQDRIETIREEASEQKTAVEKEIDEKRKAAEDTLKIQQKSIQARSKELDKLLAVEKKNLAEARQKALEEEQAKTRNQAEEVQKRIDKLNEERDAAIKAREEARKAEDEAVKSGSWETLMKAIFWNADRGNEIFREEYEKTTGKKAPGRAVGDNNWRGGPVRINEEGGEILNLPRGTQIIPHDVSVEAAKEHARMMAYLAASHAASDRALSAGQSLLSPTTTQKPVVRGGDLIIPISVNGEFAGEVRLTSTEIARQEKLRGKALGVER